MNSLAIVTEAIIFAALPKFDNGIYNYYLCLYIVFLISFNYWEHFKWNELSVVPDPYNFMLKNREWINSKKKKQIQHQLLLRNWR